MWRQIFGEVVADLDGVLPSFPSLCVSFFWWKGEGVRRTCKQREEEGVELLGALLPLAAGALLPLAATILVDADVAVGGWVVWCSCCAVGREEEVVVEEQGVEVLLLVRRLL